MRTVDGVEVRQHATVHYNSIYRADGELLVNAHVGLVFVADEPEAAHLPGVAVELGFPIVELPRQLGDRRRA